MPRRPAVLLTSPHSTSNSSLFLALLALSREGFVLTHENEAHPLPFQSLPFILSLEGHSLRVYRGVASRAFSHFSLATRLPRWHFARGHSPLAAIFFGINTYRLRTCNPFRRNTYKKPGGRGYVN